MRPGPFHKVVLEEEDRMRAPQPPSRSRNAVLVLAGKREQGSGAPGSCWMQQALFLAAILVGEVEFHGTLVLSGAPRAEKLHRLDIPPDPEVDFRVA